MILVRFPLFKGISKIWNWIYFPWGFNPHSIYYTLQCCPNVKSLVLIFIFRYFLGRDEDETKDEYVWTTLIPLSGIRNALPKSFHAQSDMQKWWIHLKLLDPPTGHMLCRGQSACRMLSQECEAKILDTELPMEKRGTKNLIKFSIEFCLNFGANNFSCLLKKAIPTPSTILWLQCSGNSVVFTGE